MWLLRLWFVHGSLSPSLSPRWLAECVPVKTFEVQKADYIGVGRTMPVAETV